MIVWAGVGVIAWVRMGATVLIAAVKYVCVSGGECGGVCVWV